MNKDRDLKKTEATDLGSGYIYAVEYDGAIPTDTDIEKDENLLGLCKGGAQIEYSASYTSDSDDFGIVTRTILTDESAVLKTGVFTWNMSTLEKLIATARTSRSEDDKWDIIKIGGAGNDNGKRYVVRFVHEDTESGTGKFTIVGKNTAGLTLAYAKDAVTTVDAEFTAQGMDDAGTLLEFKREVLPSQ